MFVLGDLGVRGVWKPHADMQIDYGVVLELIRTIDTDSITSTSHTPKAVLESAAKGKLCACARVYCTA